MKSAYNHTWLHNLAVIKETKRWWKHQFIERAQLDEIHRQYQVAFYHPNFIIRILLFVAALLALSGITGLLGLMVSDLEDFIITGCVIYGITSFIVLEKIFISKHNHYKSGVTEALLYHACGFTITGLAGWADWDTHVLLFAFLIVFTFAAIRYVDLVSTVIATLSFAAVLFYEFYAIGGLFRQIIPFVFILTFTPVYFLIRRLKQKQELNVWFNCMIIVEALSLLLIYAAGNYLVVRELSLELMDLYLEEGEDIPFAIIFYLLTVTIPVLYLYIGIRQKDIVLLRVSLLVIAFSVFTFKYYYGFGHPEFSLTIAGLLLTGITLWLFNFLKTNRSGYTRENLLSEKWGNMNVQAFIVSQTMGGNEIKVTADDQFKGGGGGFSGGGSSGSF
jgi:hypothetical protein